MMNCGNVCKWHVNISMQIGSCFSKNLSDVASFYLLFCFTVSDRYMCFSIFLNGLIMNRPQ